MTPVPTRPNEALGTATGCADDLDDLDDIFTKPTHAEILSQIHCLHLELKSVRVDLAEPDDEAQDATPPAPALGAGLILK